MDLYSNNSALIKRHGGDKGINEGIKQNRKRKERKGIMR